MVITISGVMKGPALGPARPWLGLAVTGSCATPSADCIWLAGVCTPALVKLPAPLNTAVHVEFFSKHKSHSSKKALTNALSL